MSGDEPVPEMRPFVMSLLVVATGDTRTLPAAVNLVQNAAFRYCLELAGTAPELARRAAAGDLAFGGWPEAEVEPADFFLFCGALLDAVDGRLRGRHLRLARAAGDQPSSYDHAALLALAQTLCRAAGVRRASFPALAACFDGIAASRPRELQQALLTNYLGNVLHDYFDASQIRREFPSLPPDTEDSLRSEEAAAIAASVFASLPASDGIVDTAALQDQLRDIIGRVWLAEKELDD